ncbi:hypothetical protein [Sphingomonas xinjiangensis]|uniref:Uncharacterized protein n=1 Tax=Sphingomonas xinjiangensis TaxID=643568 RepID=A0A840YDX3_9SPHN|nr:hypothetical protein [Sphingomonas xinjiangensis]MBB5711044.1 hypothetical protein [Sphingomonas xinjiangensis]
MRDIDDLFRSERHFVAFLNVLGPFLDEPRLSAMPRDLPCAAIVRTRSCSAPPARYSDRPWTTIVPGNDCSAILPPLPSLHALVIS